MDGNSACGECDITCRDFVSMSFVRTSSFGVAALPVSEILLSNIKYQKYFSQGRESKEDEENSRGSTEAQEAREDDATQTTTTTTHPEICLRTTVLSKG